MSSGDWAQQWRVLSPAPDRVACVCLFRARHFSTWIDLALHPAPAPGPTTIMSLLAQTRQALLLPKLLPSIQKRFSTRESIHRYVEPNKFKKHMLAAAEPYMRRKHEVSSETCVGTTLKEIDLHPLDRIYANELLDAINKSGFVLFIQHNYTPFQIERVYKNTLIKSGGTFFSHKNQVYKEVFNTLNIDSVQPLFTTRNSLLVGPVDKLPACVDALKRMTSFLLLAGCIDKNVYTYDQLNLIAMYPNLDSARAQLLATLETPAIDLAYYLEQHSNNMNESQPNDDAAKTPENTKSVDDSHQAD